MKKGIILVGILIMLMPCILFGKGQEETVVKGADNKVTLEVWGWNDDKQALEAVAIRYQELNPNVTINLTFAPIREYPDKLTTALAGGTNIDVMCIDKNPHYAQLASRGQLLQLDNFIQSDKADMSIYGNNFDICMYEDKVFALPYRASVIVIAYNKSIFDKMGQPYPSDDMTWDEFYELAKKLTNNDTPNGQTQYGVMLYTRNMDWMIPCSQNGWTVYDDDFSLVKVAMQYKIDAQKHGISMPHGEIMSIGTGIRALFEQERMAMYITGDWTVNQMRQSKERGTIDFEWDFASVPHLTGKPANHTEVQHSYVAVNAKSKQQAESWKFLNFLAGLEGAKIFASLGTLPGALYHPEVQAAYIGDKSLPPSNIGCLFNQELHDPYPIEKNVRAIDTIFKEESELVFIGEQSIEQAIEKIRQRRARYL